MNKLDIPFNLSLLELNDQTLSNLKPVRVLDIFDGMTKNFHNDGLFSTMIFGRVGDEGRSRRFSYIDIKVPILHPLIHHTLLQLKQLYGEIINGKAYAIFDEKEKDFVKSDQTEGSTGYTFFMSRWKDIVFEERASDSRDINIKLIKKYKDKAVTSKIVVLPAGLRDYEIEANGKESENEFNNLYRRMIAIANSISPVAVRGDLKQLDASRVSLQRTFNEIYELFKSMLEGKKKLIMGKWATRGIHNGTRNVITSTNVSIDSLFSENMIGFNDTVVGLYQYLKATLPVTKYQLRNGFLSKVFTGPNAPVNLVNKDTLEMETVQLKPRIYDQWMTDEGLERIVTSFGEESLRHQALEIEGRYVGLIYKGEGTYKLFQDIRDLPEGRDKKDVYPVTFAELMYLTVYMHAPKYPALVTRYPVTGYGSIFPSNIYLKPTVAVEKRIPLGDDWAITKEVPVAYNFPTKGSFFNSMSPAANKLQKLGGDFDGDMCSLNVLYSEESRKEAQAFLDSSQFYVGTDGRLTFSLATDTVNYFMKSFTGHPEVPGLEFYSERKTSSFTHKGKEYSVNKVFKGIRDNKLELTTFKVEDLAWIIKYGTPDTARLKKANTSKPMTVIKQAGRYYIIDGYHRLCKAFENGETELTGYLITEEILESALLD